MTLDTPSVNVNTKTNEQNVQALKQWAYETIAQLNYQITNLQTAVEELQTEVATLKGEIEE